MVVRQVGGFKRQDLLGFCPLPVAGGQVLERPLHNVTDVPLHGEGLEIKHPLNADDPRGVHVDWLAVRQGTRGMRSGWVDPRCLAGAGLAQFLHDLVQLGG